MNRQRLMIRMANLALTLALLIGGLGALPVADTRAAGRPAARPVTLARPAPVVVARSLTTRPAPAEQPDMEEGSLGEAPLSPAAAGAFWTIETVDGAALPGNYASLAIDRRDHLHVSYYDGLNADLKYATSDGGGWVTETVDSRNDTGRYTSLAVDSQNAPLISYFDDTLTALRYARWTGSTWLRTTVDNSAIVGQYSSVAYEADGDVHISYYDTTNSALQYAYWDGTTWITETIDNSGSVGQHTSIALNGGNPMVSYRNATSDSLRIANSTSPGSWNILDVNDPLDGGEYTSLALDSTGYPHITYFGADGVHYTYYDRLRSRWVDRLVEASSSEGVPTALALDVGNNPCIAYVEAGTLRYATWNGSSWDIEIIDGSGQVNADVSMALDSGGYPHITYRDYTMGLRHAWLRACVPPASVTITGPSFVYAESTATFTATVLPASANLPITTTWQYHEWEGDIVRVLTSTTGVISFTPHLTGSHPISLTVENCGGTASDTHILEVVEEPLPDLVVTDIDVSGPHLRYYGANPTSVAVGAVAGVDEVIIDGIVTTRAMQQNIGSNFYWNAMAQSGWACSGFSDTVRITIDSTDVVRELDETNNTREEVLLCDTEPPVLTSGPIVTEVTSTTARIEWDTDEESDSWVWYTSNAGDYYPDKTFQLTRKTSHEMVLTNLSPGTAYRYYVESTDYSDHTLSTKDDPGFFTTVPPSTAPAHIQHLGVQAQPGETSLMVKACLGSGVSLRGSTAAAAMPAPSPADLDRVDYYVDHTYVGTAYSVSKGEDPGCDPLSRWHINPALLGEDRITWFGEPHEVEGIAVAADGVTSGPAAWWYSIPPWVEQPVDMNVLSPYAGATHYVDESDALPAGTLFSIRVEAVQYDWECEWIDDGDSNPYTNPPDCDEVAHAVPEVGFYINGTHVHTSTTANSNFVHSYQWDASGLTPGDYDIDIVAVAGDGVKHYASTLLLVRQGEPSLDISRYVVRRGNYYDVTLLFELDEDADGAAFIDKVVDYVDEYQPVIESTNLYTATVKYPAWAGSGDRRAQITIDFHSASSEYRYLSPGNSFTVTYSLVPILYADGEADPRIGVLDIKAYYWYGAGNDYISTEFSRPWTSYSSFQHALETADYLIVTNPDRLHDLYVTDEVHDLLTTMAHLAKLKNGVLGYLQSYTGSEWILDDLIEPGGYWAEALAPTFQDAYGGYVLIVGEIEVVPAWNQYDFDICWAIPDDSWHCMVRDNDVYHHDRCYGNTGGSGAPEINVGRAIGDSAWQLERPLLVSINVYEGHNNYSYDTPGQALIVSGTGEGQSGFQDSAEDLEDELDGRGWSSQVLHWADYPGNELYWFEHYLPERDLILFRGHGNVDSWGPGLGTGNFPFDTYLHNPFVFAPSCLTGNYESGDDYNIAEAFFDNGAGVYIGSTQVSPGGPNRELVDWFLGHWNWETGETIGRAFTQVERHFYGEDGYYDWYKFWVTEYNLYGDPKFGTPPAASLQGLASLEAAPAPAVAGEPTTTLTVHFPDYVVTSTVDGFDRVEIPGGELLMEQGTHQIPYWSVSLDYEAGYRVQHVDLTAKTGGVFSTTGLILPTTAMTYYTPAPSTGGTTATVELAQDDDWVPGLDDDYSWEVTENPDGSTELRIRMFPFHYQPQTTNLEWYESFTFAIDVISTAVTIDGLALAGGAHDPGDEVAGDLWFSTAGQPQDVVAAITVRDAASGDVVDGLGLRVLHHLQGPSSYGFVWDSTGFAPGLYVVVVELEDTEGNLLASAWEEFGLGLADAAILDFLAAPEVFRPGEAVTISLRLGNTGAVTLSGTAFVEVRTADGLTVTASYSHSVANLAPTAERSLEDVWDTTGTPEGEYRVVSYFKYEARTTEVVTADLTTRRRVYLPLLLLSGP